MSRIGKKPVAIPAGVTAQIDGGILTVKGPKGALTLPLRDEIAYTVEGDTIDVPEGLEVKTPDQTTVEISGIDKQAVGQLAAEIRRWRKPEPYKGKGIKYRGEYVFRKEGKKK